MTSYLIPELMSSEEVKETAAELGVPESYFEATLIKYDPDQPRDPKGVETGGQWTGDAAPKGRVTEEEILAEAKKAAEALGFPMDRIFVEPRAPVLDVGGIKGRPIAEAHIGGPSFGDITIYADQLKLRGNLKELPSIVSHEIMHIKFQTVMNEFNSEIKKFNPDTDWLLSRKEVSRNVRDDFPVIQKLGKDLFHTKGLAEEDGVTPYSKQFWDAHNAKRLPIGDAIHETVAEMSRLKYQSNGVPRFYNPVSKQSSVTGATPRWQEFYDNVNQLYDTRLERDYYKPRRPELVKYDPDQPRHPKGDPQGGQWASHAGFVETPEFVGDPADTKKHEDAVYDEAKRLAKELGYDPQKVVVGTSDKNYEFEVNGRKMYAAGLAYTHDGRNFPKGTIQIFPAKIPYNLSTLKEIMAHEIMHHKYQSVLDRYYAERANITTVMDKVRTEGGDEWGRSGVLSASGEPREAYKGRWPVYEKFDSHTPENRNRTDVFKLAENDGVSDYSRLYWDAWKSSVVKTNGESAIHETLAEMAANHISTGGEKRLSGPIGPRGGMTMSSTGGDKIWRDLYKTVNQLYKDRDKWPAL